MFFIKKQCFLLKFLFFCDFLKNSGISQFARKFAKFYENRLKMSTFVAVKKLKKHALKNKVAVPQLDPKLKNLQFNSPTRQNQEYKKNILM
jgi:hypothetical protein